MKNETFDSFYILNNYKHHQSECLCKLKIDLKKNCQLDLKMINSYLIISCIQRVCMMCPHGRIVHLADIAHTLTQINNFVKHTSRARDIFLNERVKFITSQINKHLRVRTSKYIYTCKM